ncbi:hypothetical protein C5167_036385 [Papaver somniferum]|uniref:SKP1-like protein n=1 Tax=Papaver somniferum TaxID=3469 RepID=A0A4Y7I5S4_PAPSO|nr:hypothetical protein C5167_036385 [Papaver somniferum]
MDNISDIRICQSLPYPANVFYDLVVPTDNKVTLRTDGRDFTVDVAVAFKSLHIKGKIQLMIHSGKVDNNLVISLDGMVSGHVLELVIEYCEKHPLKYEKDVRSSDADVSDDECIEVTPTPETWDAYFDKKVDLPTLFGLILAADYLTIRSLLDLTCEEVADMIKVKTADGICEFFKIEHALIPSEEERLRRYISMT